MQLGIVSFKFLLDDELALFFRKRTMGVCVFLSQFKNGCFELPLWFMIMLIKSRHHFFLFSFFKKLKSFPFYSSFLFMVFSQFGFGKIDWYRYVFFVFLFISKHWISVSYCSLGSFIEWCECGCVCLLLFFMYFLHTFLFNFVIISMISLWLFVNQNSWTRADQPVYNGLALIDCRNKYRRTLYGFFLFFFSCMVCNKFYWFVFIIVFNNNLVVVDVIVSNVLIVAGRGLK